MKRILGLLATLAMALSLVALAPQGADAGERYGKQKVVYHINYDGGDGDKRYIGAMRNIQNHINAVGAENLDIKVVMHGNGVAMLMSAKKNERLRGQILELKGQNVSMHVCNNTLVGRKIDYDKDLFDVYEEDIVPSGVAELAHLQHQGYAYIKP